MRIKRMTGPHLYGELTLLFFNSNPNGQEISQQKGDHKVLVG